MIGRLHGVLALKQPPFLLLDVRGIGYEVETPLSTFYKLPEVGAEVTLFTHLTIREDAHLLFGFSTLAERGLFRSLIKVSGVGPKLALLILSGMTVELFSRCVQEGDSSALVRLPGIGKKTAERLIIEMRDRIGVVDLGPGLVAGSDSGGPTAPTTHIDDAISALVVLGYKPTDATRMVRAINTQGLASEDILRIALQSAVHG